MPGLVLGVVMWCHCKPQIVLGPGVSLDFGARELFCKSFRRCFCHAVPLVRCNNVWFFLHLLGGAVGLSGFSGVGRFFRR